MPRLLQNMRHKLSGAKPHRRSVRPALEGLEDRMLLFAANGGMWTYPVRVTYSFAPDGTSVGGVPSSLFSTMNATQSTAAWQGAIKQAAALWETVANVNLVNVPDNGAPMGSDGNQQGDSRFGDIRIAAIPQGGGVLAGAALPPPYNGGTNAGDITFNSSMNWSPTGGFDLESVALHEFGHALGLDHSAQMSAVMYAYYSGPNQSPASDDVAGIQYVYGAIPYHSESNQSIYTAWNLTPNINSAGQLAIANQSILGTQDCNWWYVAAPANTTGTLTVQMQATNLSSLSPKLVIYNSAGTLLKMSNNPDQYGSTATATITGVTAGQGFYIRCSTASYVGSNGAYGLLANFGASTQPPIAPPYTVVAQQADRGGGGANLVVGLTTAISGSFASLVSTFQAGLAARAGGPGSSLGLSQPLTSLLAGLNSSSNLGSSPYLSQLTSQISTLTTLSLGNMTVYGDYLMVADAKAVPSVEHATDTGAFHGASNQTAGYGRSTSETPTGLAIIPMPGSPSNFDSAAPTPSGGAGAFSPTGWIALATRHRHRPTQ